MVSTRASPTGAPPTRVSLRLAGCRLLHLGTGSCCYTRGHVLEARNCEFLSDLRSIGWDTSTGGETCLIDNCLIVVSNSGAITLGGEELKRLSVRLTRNTVLSTGAAMQVWEGCTPSRLETADNIFATPSTFSLTQLTRPDWKGARETDAEALLRRVVTWSEKRNMYAPGAASMHWTVDWQPEKPHGPTTLVDWNRYWKQTGTGSLEGRVSFAGGNLLAQRTSAPEKLTPDDFRLRPDSAGYQAGKDKQDLGADVDLVGPGAAYERWKKLPEYQQWLEDKGQEK